MEDMEAMEDVAVIAAAIAVVNLPLSQQWRPVHPLVVAANLHPAVLVVILVAVAAEVTTDTAGTDMVDVDMVEINMDIKFMF